VSHGYLADVIDSLGTIEANYRAQKARWLSIDFYGLTLGSNISEYPNLFGTFLNNSGDGKDSLLDNSQITSQLPDAAKALGEIDLVALKKDYSNHMHSQKDYIVQNVTNRAARNELLDHLVKLRTASWSSTYQKYQEARYHYLRADLEYQLRLAANLSENWDLNNRRGYLEKETGLVAIPAKGSMHGWDSLVVEVGKHGTLEGIQFLKKFENSRNVTDFYFALRDELSRKFSPLNGETGSFNDSGYYILYGIPNETIYNARIKDLTLTSLEDFIKVENAFEADPYIINKSLDCIRVFYDVDHSVVWLSVESFVARLAKEGGNNSTLNGM
jgi:hypothetical protein